MDAMSDEMIMAQAIAESHDTDGASEDLCEELESRGLAVPTSDPIQWTTKAMPLLPAAKALANQVHT